MNTFELDLLGFHGKPLHIALRGSGEQMSWLFEGTDSDYSLVEGADFVMELDASLIDTTIRLKGTMRAQFEFNCGRCLELRPIDLDAEVEFVLMSRPSWRKAYEEDAEIELSPEDLDVSYYEGDLIDLRPIIREAVLLELPNFALCSPEISEQCDEAYERNIGEEAVASNEEAQVDLRWTALRNVKLADPGSDKDVN
ncbi:MAG: DUF177 domain-containing protein [Bradymonadaceae bacterium]|nr:DUF177 domain-containing protein [Lujinxingiaceae bacterium]